MMDRQQVLFSSKAGTELWRGDVAIAGGSCAALSAAQELRSSGKSVCILAPGPVLGVEISRQWLSEWPGGILDEGIHRTCGEMGIPCEGHPDILGSTIAFDDFVTAHGIAAYVRMQPTRILLKRSGMLMGLEAVGRSGRQLISANILVDATPGRALSRRFLGEKPPVVVGASLGAFIYGYGGSGGAVELPSVPECGGLEASVTPLAWPGEAVFRLRRKVGCNETNHDIHYALYSRILPVFELLKKSNSAFAEASVLSIAPEVECVFAEAEYAMLPRQEELQQNGIYVLPQNPSWVESVKTAPWCVSAAVPATAPYSCCGICSGVDEKDGRLECEELRSDIDQDLPEMQLPPALAFLEPGTEVLVAGMGCSGAIAALAAARQGADVSIVDPVCIPGGIATAGRIHSYYLGLHGGLQEAFDAKSIADSHGNPYVGSFHPEGRALDLLNSIIETGKTTIYTGHVIFGVVKEDKRVCAVVTADAAGYHIFPCQVAIDCTGEGDVAVAAGAEYRLGRDGDGFPNPYSYTPTRICNGKTGFANFDVGYTDPTDSIEFSRAHIVGRQAIKHAMDFTPEQHYCTLSDLLGIREGRLIVGRESVTYGDFMEGRKWPDAVCASRAHHDNHSMEYDVESDWSRKHVAIFGLWRNESTGQIPYGAFVPKGIDGLLVSGRAISIDHDLSQLVRMQRDMQVFGEVCGIAAAESIRQGVMVGDLDVDALRAILVQRGITVPEVQPEADKSVPELLQDLLTPAGADEKQKALIRNLAIWRLSQLTRENGGEFWETFIKDAPEEARFPAALAAGMGGNRLPEVLKILEQSAMSDDATPGTGFKVPARCVVAALVLAELGAESTFAVLSHLLDGYGRLDVVKPAEVPLLIQAFEKCGKPTAAAQAILAFRAEHLDDMFPVTLWGCGPGMPQSSMRYAFDLRCAATLKKLAPAKKREIFEILMPYFDHSSLLVRKFARSIWR